MAANKVSTSLGLTPSAGALAFFSTGEAAFFSAGAEVEVAFLAGAAAFLAGAEEDLKTDLILEMKDMFVAIELTGLVIISIFLVIVLEFFK